MPPTDFKSFFAKALHAEAPPYEYQCRLACGENARADAPETLRSGSECQSRLIDIPTGLGKTAAVVLAWAWNRIALADETWPRRLVYCLPMRTLVEQTRDEVQGWMNKLAATGAISAAPRVVILMGGEDPGDADWDLYPEDNAILIGTQDMLLSRALNRGYGMARARWPMHFGLLNNDCLWVVDEMQLMGVGLGTACQLEAFRNGPPQGMSSFGSQPSVTWYMSATTAPEHLQTRDWRGVSRPNEFPFRLSDKEKALTSGSIHDRRFAVKRLELKEEKNAESSDLIADILKCHEEMLKAINGDPALPARTLIICNTVDRATALHAQLAKSNKLEGCDLLLLHSRFRASERRAQMERLKVESLAGFPQGQIVVATQVIEAGVDISSGVLWTEVAPLASLVQRFGRLNRAGEFNASRWKPLSVVFGVGVKEAPPRENKEARSKREKENTKCCLPYDFAISHASWATLKKLNGDASPALLEIIQSDIAASIEACPYSLQRHELLDFFDTDANLSLGFTDVSPFVRGLDIDTDLQVLWRENWPQKDGEEGTGKPSFTPDFQRDELCPVPISKAKDARSILNQGWIWRGKESGWISVRDAGLAPGMTVLLPLDAGGYDNQCGWTGDPKDKNHGSHYQPRNAISDEEQLSSLANGWQNIAEHTQMVKDELSVLLDCLLPRDEFQSQRHSLLNAATWHDIGKNHSKWQNAVTKTLEEAGISGNEGHRPFAKFSLSDSPSLAGLQGSALHKRVGELRRAFRPGIAHEVASALAFRQAEQARLGPGRDEDFPSLLAEYLIMSHHGRVRKALRDELPKLPDSKRDTDTVRGVADGDPLPAVEIAGQTYGCDSLSTDCRRMGRGADGHESYTRAVLRLLDHYGPFRLAYFEAIFRAADCRASKTVKPGGAFSAFSSMEIREEPTAYDASGRLTPAEQSLIADLVADGLSIQHKFRPEPLYKQTGKGHYEGRTVDEMQQSKSKKGEKA